MVTARVRRFVPALVLCGAEVACGRTTTDPATPQAVAGARGASGSSVEPYFPLEDGRLYHYVTTEGGESGMLVARVRRTSPTAGELVLSNATKRFVYDASGVAYEGGAYVLRAPLDVGASWPGEHGGTTRITSVTADVTVPAGVYASCVITEEDGGRPPGAIFVTTYCPGVGIVRLEVRASGGEARVELKSYGAPVTIDLGEPGR